MPWINPITDRTQADADWAAALARRIQKDGWDSLSTEERLDWMAGLKGAYNADDLNRVGECVQYLADMFNGYGYAVAVEAKSDWVMEDLPTTAPMQTHINNVKSLIAAYYILPDTPDLPESMDDLTIAGANDIEKALRDMEILLGYMTAAFLYCGEIFSGEV